MLNLKADGCNALIILCHCSLRRTLVIVTHCADTACVGSTNVHVQSIQTDVAKPLTDINRAKGTHCVPLTCCADARAITCIHECTAH